MGGRWGLDSNLDGSRQRKRKRRGARGCGGLAEEGAHAKGAKSKRKLRKEMQTGKDERNVRDVVAMCAEAGFPLRAAA